MREQQPQAKGFTTDEIAQAWGLSQEVARRYVRRGIRAGVIRCTGRKAAMRMDGTPTLSPCYTVVED